MHRLGDVIEALKPTTAELVLFGHAFAGSDTTSAIFNFGKTVFFSKLEKCRELRLIAKEFYSDDVSPEEIGKYAEDVFRLIFATGKKQSIAEIRHSKYENMVISDRKSLDPAYLPPTARAAHFHGQRVYHQLKVWRNLSDQDENPSSWGWKLEKKIISCL